MTIVRRGGKVLLLSHLGKVLGRHDSVAEAKSQERAIDISKARKAGHHIPPPPRKRRG